MVAAEMVAVGLDVVVVVAALVVHGTAVLAVGLDVVVALVVRAQMVAVGLDVVVQILALVFRHGRASLESFPRVAVSIY